MIIRRVHGTISLVMITVLFAGCVQVPQRVSSTPPPRPSVHEADVPAIQERYHEARVTASEDGDNTALSRLQGQPLLGAQMKSHALHHNLGTSPDPPSAMINTVTHPTVAGDYPRTFVTVAEVADSDEEDPEEADSGETDSGDEDWRRLDLYQRASAAEVWRKHFSVAIDREDLPDLATDADGRIELVSVDSEEYGRAPAAVAALLAKGLEDRKSEAGQQFAETDPWKETHDWMRARHDQETADGADFAFTFSAGEEVTALRAAEGVVTLATIDQSAITTADSGWHLYFPDKSAEKKLHPGEYRTIAYRDQVQVLVHQTDDAKLHLLGLWYVRTGIEAR